MSSNSAWLFCWLAFCEALLKYTPIVYFEMISEKHTAVVYFLIHEYHDNDCTLLVFVEALTQQSTQLSPTAQLDIYELLKIFDPTKQISFYHVNLVLAKVVTGSGVKRKMLLVV